MGNPRKWNAGMAPAATGPAPITPPASTRSNPAGMVNRYSEHTSIPPAKGAKPPAKKPAAARKRRM